MLDPIHPFPARMAPEIAFDFLGELPKRSIILDPMCGSGVALRIAVERGHRCIGNDADPLAVLMSQVWIDPHKYRTLPNYAEQVVSRAARYSDLALPWHNDGQTAPFAEFWFARQQREDLARLGLALHRLKGSLPLYVSRALRLALSRLIVTKTRGASLAWDVAHSRPHIKKSKNDFDVVGEFLRASSVLATKLSNNDPTWSGNVRRGDARKLPVADASVDAIITSPPYLNAIDYLRGHRLSLIWLGHSITSLRTIRSNAIGSEAARHKRLTVGGSNRKRAPDRRTLHLMDQYVLDLGAIMRELKRVARRKAKICVITANSNIRGYEVRTNTLVQAAAAGAGLRMTDEKVRVIEKSRRYLPTKTSDTALRSRMMEEHIQYFVA